MGIIMRNNIAYSGGGGSETVELSMAEYEAREAAGAIDSDTWYLIYDANDSYNAKKIVYDNAESGMEASTVQGAIDELNSNLDGVSFVVDSAGKITGYTTNTGGADTVFPFRSSIEYQDIEYGVGVKTGTKTIEKPSNGDKMILVFTSVYDNIPSFSNNVTVTKLSTSSAPSGSNSMTYLITDINDDFTISWSNGWSGYSNHVTYVY